MASSAGQPIRFALKLNPYGQRQDLPFSALVDLAQAAEAAGFAGVYCIDHLVLDRNLLTAFSPAAEADPGRPYFLEAWTTLAALAARTRRVRIGPQVTPIALRHPVFIAKMGATLDRISDGRLTLQVGAGWNREEFETFGFPFDEAFAVRYAKMVEGVEIIQRLWTEDAPVTYTGQHYRLTAAPAWPKPVQRPRPPLWFGGTSAKIRRAVARYGDGWTPAAPHYTGLDPDFYAKAWGEICAWAAEAGRDPAALTPGALFCTTIDRDGRRARQVASRLRKRREWADMSLEELERRGIVIAGDPEDCIRGIERYVRAGVRHFSLSFIPLSDIEATLAGIRLYGDAVLPHFAGQGAR